MANKYIIHGATYNGDGTSSAEATSNGGVGAWNRLDICDAIATANLGGGTLVAGDTVYIRSKDASGNDIIRTLTAHINIGSAAATSTAPITWILDNGTVWPGIDGTLTYTNATAYTATYRVNNIFVAKTHHNWITQFTGSSPVAPLAIMLGYGDWLAFDFAAKTSSGTAVYVGVWNGGVLNHPLIRCGRIADLNTSFRGAVRFEGSGGVISLICPEIELTWATPTGVVFGGAPSVSGYCKVVGGRVFGVGAVSGQAVFGTYPLAYASFIFDCVGFAIPRSMDVINTAADRCNGFEVRLSGSDDVFGGHLETPWGFATSRTDNNPPYLAATLPDSNLTAWSWRIWPRSASEALPMVLTNAKLYPGTAAVKTITQELLVANTMASNAKTLWMEVTYVDDATGLTTSVSTRDYSASALTASSANWSSTVWGMVTLLKRKLEITTPTAIKQDTAITVTLMGTLGAATVNDIYFADPDFGVN